MSVYTLVIVIHVLAGMFLVGGAFAEAGLRLAIRRAGTRQDVLALIRHYAAALKPHPLVAFLLLGTGIWLGSSGWWSTAWFAVSATAWVMNVVLSVTTIKPSAKSVAAAAMSGSGDAVDAALETARTRRLWHLGASSLFANNLGFVWVMYMKPGLAGSLAAFAIANAVILSLVLMTGVRASRPAVAGT